MTTTTYRIATGQNGKSHTLDELENMIFAKMPAHEPDDLDLQEIRYCCPNENCSAGTITIRLRLRHQASPIELICPVCQSGPLKPECHIVERVLVPILQSDNRQILKQLRAIRASQKQLFEELRAGEKPANLLLAGEKHKPAGTGLLLAGEKPKITTDLIMDAIDVLTRRGEKYISTHMLAKFLKMTNYRVKIGLTKLAANGLIKGELASNKGQHYIIWRRAK